MSGKRHCFVPQNEQWSIAGKSTKKQEAAAVPAAGETQPALSADQPQPAAAAEPTDAGAKKAAGNTIVIVLYSA